MRAEEICQMKRNILWWAICTALVCVGCVRYPTGEEVCNPTNPIFVFFNENKETWVDYFTSLPNGVTPAIEVESPFSRFVVSASGYRDSEGEFEYLYYVVEAKEHPLTIMGTLGLAYLPSGEVSRHSYLNEFELTLIRDNVFCYQKINK